MPMLLNLLRTPDDKKYRMLQARGMECAGLIGMAVGKEQFAQDALALATILAEIQSTFVK